MNDFRKTLGAISPDSDLLDKLDEKLSAAQESHNELDDVPLVASWASDKRQDECMQGVVRMRDESKVEARDKTVLAHRKVQVISIAALLLLAVVGVCSVGLEGFDGLAMKEAPQQNVGFEQFESWSDISGAPSEVIGTMEIEDVRLVHSSEGVIDLEASIAVNLPAYANESVPLSVEDNEGSEIGGGIVAFGVGGPFTIKCSLRGPSDDDGDLLEPMRLITTYIQWMRGNVLVIGRENAMERARVDVGELGDDAIGDFVEGNYKENGGIVVLNLVLCHEWEAD